MAPYRNGLAQLFSFLVRDGRSGAECREVAKIMKAVSPQQDDIARRWQRAEDRAAVEEEARNLTYRLWRLRVPTPLHLALLFSEGRQEEVVGVMTQIADTWYHLKVAGAGQLLKEIEAYQRRIIAEAGPFADMLLSPYNSMVPNMEIESGERLDAWMGQWLQKGIPNYNYRREHRHIKMTVELPLLTLERVQFRELRVPEAGHEWLPTRREITELWRDCPVDPVAPPYRSPPATVIHPTINKSLRLAYKTRTDNVKPLMSRPVVRRQQQLAATTLCTPSPTSTSTPAPVAAPIPAPRMSILQRSRPINSASTTTCMPETSPVSPPAPEETTTVPPSSPPQPAPRRVKRQKESDTRSVTFAPDTKVSPQLSEKQSINDIAVTPSTSSPTCSSPTLSQLSHDEAEESAVVTDMESETLLDSDTSSSSEDEEMSEDTARTADVSSRTIEQRDRDFMRQLDEFVEDAVASQVPKRPNPFSVQTADEEARMLAFCKDLMSNYKK